MVLFISGRLRADAVAILLPALMSIARETDIPRDKLLIPVARGSLRGGNMISVGPPANKRTQPTA